MQTASSYATAATSRSEEPRTMGRRRWQSLYRPQSPVARLANFLCGVLLMLMLVAGVILFVLWLSLRPHRPRFYLADFSIPSVNRQSGLANLPVHFTVNEHNPNQKIGMSYDEIVASVFYGDQLVATGPVMNPFYQPANGDTTVQGTLTARGPVPTDPSWGRFAGELAAGSVGEMRLVLTSKVQFQVKLWDTKHHHMKVECDFTMLGDGTLRPQDKNSQCTLYF